ncbi:hypothetical protein IP69_05070 [Bosea sp. AAP35]|uniref:hypothetical protein n=1 Tax=Bosea sp. AAP35 TaxID=1523417 RepID=UPI0006B8D5C6|nr:hypothetical protein [Bosea sp. AAP35]KPF71848.1 hypothetical protein IP69_05070 [Bosea sp. AAP35]
MSRALRITGLFLASLTIVTVALSQQSSGTGRGDLPPLKPIVTAADQGKARLSRVAEPRRALTDCPVAVCDTPPEGVRTVQDLTRVSGGCNGDGTVARDRNGKIIRRICLVF